jgi:hypothetical protein
MTVVASLTYFTISHCGEGERGGVCVIERGGVCVCVRERGGVRVRERGRERERERASERESERQVRPDPMFIQPPKDLQCPP